MNVTVRPLHVAVRAGNLQDVVEILGKGADVEDAIGPFKVRPLHIAAEEGHLEVLKALISRGANVNAQATCADPLSKTVERGPTPLHLAARHANPNLVLALISAGANVNAKSSSMVFPLHIAAQHGNLSVVKALVSAGANVNAVDNVKVTPLFAAVAQNFENVAEFLVQNGAVVNARNSDRVTPLHFAAENGNVNIAKLLVQNKAAIDAKNVKGFTPLHSAVQYRQAAVIKFLINSGADVNARDNEGWTPLFNAVQSGYPAETSRILIAKGARVKVRVINGRLLRAVENDFPDIVNILIENKADVNATDNRGWTSLHLAAYEGSLDVIKILIASGAIVDAFTRSRTTPLHFAADNWHVDVVKYLLAKGAKVNAPDDRNWTPLHCAADMDLTVIIMMRSGRSERQSRDSIINTMKALIENGADINAKGSDDQTPLHVAAFGDEPIFAYLLENGAYYDALSQSGTIMALDIAAARNNETLIALLSATENLFGAVKKAKCTEIAKFIQEGASVNSRSTKHETPLMYASWKGLLAVVNVLLNYGANVNLSNSNGASPLHYAAKFGHHEIVCALLQHGAVYNARTKTGKKTPLDFAQEGGKKEVAEFLQLIENLFDQIGKTPKTITVSNVLNEVRGCKSVAELLAISHCKNVDGKTLMQVQRVSNNCGLEKFCKLFGDL